MVKGLGASLCGEVGLEDLSPEAGSERGSRIPLPGHPEKGWGAWGWAAWGWAWPSVLPHYREAEWASWPV